MLKIKAMAVKDEAWSHVMSLGPARTADVRGAESAAKTAHCLYLLSLTHVNARRS